MDENEETIQSLEEKISKLEDELVTEKSNYKQLTMDIGQEIFKYEELEKEKMHLEAENKRLQEEITVLKSENETLQEFKKEVESSRSYRISKMF